MPKITGNERKYGRKKFSFLLKCKTGKGKSEQVIVSNLHDISAGGLSFHTNDAISVKSEIQAEILVPQISYPITIEGRVVRVEESSKRKTDFLVGVKFTKIGTGSRKALADFESLITEEAKRKLFNIVIRK